MVSFKRDNAPNTFFSTCTFDPAWKNIQWTSFDRVAKLSSKLEIRFHLELAIDSWLQSVKNFARLLAYKIWEMLEKRTRYFGDFNASRSS